MKVSPIYVNNLNGYCVKPMPNGVLRVSSNENEKNISDLSGMPFVYPVSFSSLANSSKLRLLFSYGLPCMYTGIPMIDPKVLSRMQKSQLFSKPASEVIEALKPYNDSFIGMEAKVLELIRDRAAIHPEKTVKELLLEVEPIYRRRLRKKQAPIFRELTELSHSLPEHYQKNFRILMQDTDNKLNEKPIIIPFSSYEFKYRLGKIRDDILNTNNVKAKKVMNKLIKESKRFSNSTNANTIENQKKVLNFFDIILKTSVLKENEALRNLIDVSKSRLTKEEIIVPFSRKAFIYDLSKLIDGLDQKTQEKFILTAQKLPTSQESFSAYVLKIAAESSEKIGHRVIWPSLASVEHILPRANGGPNELFNYGGATTRANSARKNIDFIVQMKLVPETRQYTQKYLDRLIELYHQGVFRKINLSPKYITDFANSVYEQSRHGLKLDLSKLYNQSA